MNYQSRLQDRKLPAIKRALYNDKMINFSKGHTILNVFALNNKV